MRLSVSVWVSNHDGDSIAPLRRYAFGVLIQPASHSPSGSGGVRGACCDVTNSCEIEYNLPHNDLLD